MPRSSRNCRKLRTSETIRETVLRFRRCREVTNALTSAEQPERGAAPRASQPPPSPWALATSTMRWNEYACDLIARNQIGQFPASRVLAYVNLSINNAIVLARQQGRKPDGAAAGAAATTLIYLFPKDEQAIAGRLAGETAAMGTDGTQAECVAEDPCAAGCHHSISLGAGACGPVAQGR
jgi:hypothetical protein